jgi:hypothetical protein
VFSIYDVSSPQKYTFVLPSMSVVLIRVQIYFSGSKKGAIKSNEWKENMRPIWTQQDSRRTATVATQDLFVFVRVEKSVP